MVAHEIGTTDPLTEAEAGEMLKFGISRTPVDYFHYGRGCRIRQTQSRAIRPKFLTVCRKP